jgi:HD-GYP domain-containing protein (c-di-GMP phosphodiesterase class II)
MLCNSRLNLAECAHRQDRAMPCNSAVTEIIHQLAESLGKAIDAKDTYTLAHSEEVAVISQTLTLSMGLGHQMADLIHVAGHLHDLGKIGVPDDILAKTSALTPKEWLAIRKHPDIGADILAPIACLRECGIVDMVRAHHEHFDGSGYPQGLAGAHIPLGARIIAVADSLSAMLQSRPYRAAKTFDEACREIARGMGSQFDPKVVEAFARVKDRVRDLVAMLRID